MNHNITIYQGSTFRLEVGWEDSDGEAIDMTGYEGRAQVRSSARSSAISLEFTVEVDPEADLPISVTATDEETADLSLPASQGAWDLEVESAGGDVHRLLYGKVTLVPEVTR
jgi:hypothetical protein